MTNHVLSETRTGFVARVFPILVASLLASSVAGAQGYQPRTDYGRYLEPAGRILHGAGQDPGRIGGAGQDAFVQYRGVMPDDARPMSYMVYESLRNIGKTWAADLKTRLLPFADRQIVLQFGLHLVGSTESIPTGALDEDIKNWLDGIEELGLPVYVRLGYEFNGLAWNGYQPAPYRAAFRYLTAKIRERDLEIATVWNYVPDPTQPQDFMSYFPGDDVVDWWAINFFEPAEIGGPLATAFLDSAAVHRRPVLIGESTPRGVGVLGGQASWNAWFAPFFRMVAAEPGIKMTGYINWDWSQYPEWSTWGDARIERNAVVSGLMVSEMRNPIYLHAGSERAFRELLGYQETVAPPAVSDLQVDASAWPARITWTPVADESGISRYLVHADGRLVDFTKRPLSVPGDLPSGTLVSVTVTAVDRAGNPGPASQPVAFVVPIRPTPAVTGELVVNGEFDAGIGPWALTSFVDGAAGTVAVDPGSTLSGPNAAHVVITRTTGTNWHLQFEQPLKVKAGRRYAITYQARASKAARIEVWLQKTASPYTGYYQKTLNLTTATTVRHDTVTVSVADNVYMRFMLGTAGTAEIWVDAVSIKDLSVATDVDSGPDRPDAAFRLDEPFPNPSGGIVSFPYSMSRPGHVRLDVFDLTGRRLAVLEDGMLSAGEHTARWVPGDAATGVYFARLSAEGGSASRPVVLRR